MGRSLTWTDLVQDNKVDHVHRTFVAPTANKEWRVKGISPTLGLMVRRRRSQCPSALEVELPKTERRVLSDGIALDGAQAKADELKEDE
jgi:hypothetical protein